MPTVSVIIPVYNVLPYLERCVRSVLRQTRQPNEVLLIDDGSTDGSSALCDALAAANASVHVVHQANQGLAGARNTGVRQAQGDYLLFLDADDEWLPANGLEQLMPQADGSTDLILYRHTDFWPSRPVVTVGYADDLTGRLHPAAPLFATLMRTQQFGMSACFVMVRRQLLLSHGIEFPLGYISEDVHWSLHVWQHASAVYVSPVALYAYHHRAGSLSASTTLRVDESYDRMWSTWTARCREGARQADVVMGYLANLWVSRGYHYYQHRAADKPAVRCILRRHAGLLNYAATPKARRVARLVRLLGVRPALWLLGCYWQLRGIMKRTC